MTLTELRYIVTLAREQHFGHAAERCFVSQPTLSIAVKKLEDELGVAIFERTKSRVYPTPLGEQIITQAQKVLEQISSIKDIEDIKTRQFAIHGKTIYDNLCAGCHTSGAGGAPKLVRAEWTARLAQGMDTLNRHAIEGFVGEAGMMPAKGGNPALTDEQVVASVDWMIENLQ